MKQNSALAMPIEFEQLFEILNTQQLSAEKVKEIFLVLYPNSFVLSERIRHCTICKSLFWQQRTNSITCSDGCGNTLKQKNYQSRHKEAIKKSRREKYLLTK